MFHFFLALYWECKGPLKYVLLSGLLFVSLSVWGYSAADVYLPVTMDYITANTVRCRQSHRNFFILPPARTVVQIKHCHDFSVSGQRARAPLWVIAAAEAFYVSQFSSQWKPTCFYKSSPLRNTCTEQQAHCFPLSYIVKIERRERQHQAGLLNHSSFLAPLGWLKSSCQKHFSVTDVGLEIL